MHSDRKKHGSRNCRDANFKLPTILDDMREARHQEHRQTKTLPPPSQVKAGANRYGQMPSDLDRIMGARSSDEVVKVVNEVLQVLERWVGIAGVSKTICSQAFQSASELREAAQSNVGQIQSNDAEAIVQTVLAAAGERFRQLDPFASVCVSPTKADSHTP